MNGQDGQGRLVEDHPMPTLGKADALVQVLRAGICNTDLELMRGYKGRLRLLFVQDWCASHFGDFGHDLRLGACK